MNIFIEISLALSFFVFGYLIGSIPTGVIIGKTFFHKDPRDYGSKGSGGTNSSRVLGKKVGVIVIVLDILKTLLVFWTCWLITFLLVKNNIVKLWDNGILYVWLSVFCCAIGHCYPLYINFKGGKAVACYMGLTGGSSWLMFCLDFIVFFSIYKIGKKKNIVSFASIISSAILTTIIWLLVLLHYLNVLPNFLMWDFGFSQFLFFTWEYALVTTLTFLLLTFRHRENIARLRKGEEKKYNLFGK